MNKQEKTWNSSFLLDGAKLTRLHEEMSQRLHRAGTSVNFKFTANTRKNILTTRERIGDVLQLDNTRKDPITALSIDGTAETNGTVQLRASVEFRPYTSASPEKRLQLSVSGEDQTLVNELFAAGYEQVERALVRPWGQFAALVGFVVIFAISVALVLGPPGRSFRALLSQQDVKELSAMAAAAQTAEAKSEFLFQVQQRELAGMASQQGWPVIGEPSQTGLIAAGAVILLTCSVLLYLALVCYPSGVFAWGDYGEYYAALISRRRGIWKFLLVEVATALLIGLVGAFLQTWLRPGSR